MAEENLIIEPRRLEYSLFEDIYKYLDDIEYCQKQEKEDQRKIEMLSKHVEAATELIAKAEDKKEALLKKNEFLKSSLASMHEKASKAIEYWKNYGLEVKQLSDETDDFGHYEFIYTKLREDNVYTIGIKFSDKKLQIVSQNPVTLSEEQVDELNTKLTSQCVNSANKPDYKSAMIIIKKILMESLRP